MSLDLKEEKVGANLKSFGREFQTRGAADRKPRDACAVRIRGSARRWTEEDRSARVGAYSGRRDERQAREVGFNTCMMIGSRWGTTGSDGRITYPRIYT